METDDACDVRAAAGKFNNGRAAEAIADGRDAF